MVKAVTYRGPQLREVAFPLGGIGAGCVSLEGRGSLRDWEIYNRPAKGTLLDFTFPVLWCQEEGQPSQTRTVQGPFNRDFVGGGFGISRAQASGLPCFASTVFRGRFPFAHVEFEQPNYPLQVSLRAFSPFIPLDHDSSAMPVACLTYTLRNRTKRPVRATLAWSMNNPVGQGVPISSEDPNKALNTFRNTFPSGAHCRGIYFENTRFAPDDHRHGTAALTTSWTDITYTTSWLRDVGWFDSTHHFWDTFS
ncbi:MAG: hypothetical protein IT442_11510, partial [Phycisphaeraceae bacterium]|nr:hypothetical protein [Phycisphaeraceae bacterium]